MINALRIYFRVFFYAEDVEWLQDELKFLDSLKKPEVREMYQQYVEWEWDQLKKFEDKIKSL